MFGIANIFSRRLGRLTKSGRLRVQAVFLAVARLAASASPAWSCDGEGWRIAEAPERVAPGTAFRLLVRVRNGTARTWDRAGNLRVTVGCVLVDSNGSPMPSSPPPMRLVYPLPPGAWGSALPVTVTSPALPGVYTLLFAVQRREKGQWTAEEGPPLRWRLDVTAAVNVKKPGP